MLYSIILFDSSFEKSNSCNFSPDLIPIILYLKLGAIALAKSRIFTDGIFGTKMRSVIKEHSTSGIHDVVKQQFEVGAEILSAG